MREWEEYFKDGWMFLKKKKKKKKEVNIIWSKSL